MLKPNGEILMAFISNKNPLYTTYAELSKIDMWKPYTKDYEGFIPHFSSEDPDSELNSLFKQVGLEVLSREFLHDRTYESEERNFLGIATASRLLENNITDFVILEAEDRIGGRIHSFHFGNAVIDLGAQYIHGRGENIAFTLARNYVVENTDEDNVEVYYSGRLKTGEDLVKRTEQYYYELRGIVQNIGLSIGDVYLARYNTSIIAEYGHDMEMLSYAKHLLKNLEGGVLGNEGAYNWFSVSALSNFQDFEGSQLISWNGLGYKTILDILLKNYPKKTGYNIENKVLFGKTVDKITVKDDQVEVKCKDGTKYSSFHVVFTPSLGVLKHDHKNIFEPELSIQKVEAIEHLGFDGIIKILVEFSEHWWQGSNFLFVWSDEDIRNLHKEVLYGPRTNDDHWLSWFSYMCVAPNNSLAMIAWYSGPFVEEVEKLSEVEMRNAVSYVMRKHLGRNYNFTIPKRVIHSQWCTNPNFRGTYSYESVQLKMRNITSSHESLSDPIRGKDGIPRILFAGEATHPTRFSTVDGAIESGFREGDRLVKILRAKSMT